MIFRDSSRRHATKDERINPRRSISSRIDARLDGVWDQFHGSMLQIEIIMLTTCSPVNCKISDRHRTNLSGLRNAATVDSDRHGLLSFPAPEMIISGPPFMISVSAILLQFTARLVVWFFTRQLASRFLRESQGGEAIKKPFLGFRRCNRVQPPRIGSKEGAGQVVFLVFVYDERREQPEFARVSRQAVEKLIGRCGGWCGYGCACNICSNRKRVSFWFGATDENQRNQQHVAHGPPPQRGGRAAREGARAVWFLDCPLLRRDTPMPHDASISARSGRVRLSAATIAGAGCGAVDERLYRKDPADERTACIRRHGARDSFAGCFYSTPQLTQNWISISSAHSSVGW